MLVTTFQKVTLFSCSVLCLSLFLPKMLLPRGKKDVGQADVRPGYYPPMMHRLPVPEDQGLWEEGSVPPLTQSLDIMAKVKSMSGASRPSLLGQVIPIYGFGILLYILFIFYKMTSKGKPPTKSDGHFPPTPNQRNPISDYELARLQQRLQETEQLMEMIVSGTSRAPDRLPSSVKRGKCRSKSRRLSKSKGGSRQQRQREKEEEEEEDRLRLQLKDISRVMEEGRTEAASPEIEAEEVTYTEDWDGYPEETYPQYEEPCGRRRYDTVSLVVEEPGCWRPTPEALAERMEVEEEEVEVDTRLPVLLEEEEEEEEQGEREGLPPALGGEGGRGQRLEVAVGRELWPSPKAKKQISFNEHKDVFQYPKERFYEGQEEEEDDEEEEEDEEEEDPLIEAESLLLDYDVCRNPEAEAEEEVDEEECLLLSLPPPPRGGSPTPSVLMRDLATSGVRMRNRRET
ncbi:protein RIC-3 [Osmerus eperlanus]|uniref:protein RIC-3 n=1 Tax=Osmerus eperlanus TaxID=29151 RepID=UPI002E136428